MVDRIARPRRDATLTSRGIASGSPPRTRLTPNGSCSPTTILTIASCISLHLFPNTSKTMSRSPSPSGHDEQEMAHSQNLESQQSQAEIVNSSYPEPPVNSKSVPFQLLASLYEYLQNERKPEKRRNQIAKWFAVCCGLPLRVCFNYMTGLHSRDGEAKLEMTCTPSFVCSSHR